MAARLLATARVGLALIVAPIAWLRGWAGWNYTRIEVVLLTPGYKEALGESGLRPTHGTVAR